MRVVVDLTRCQGYAQCAFLAPDAFQMVGDEGLMFDPAPDDVRRDDVLRAAAACPVQAILVDMAIKGTVVLCVAGLLATGFRRASAALRHLIWALAIGGLLAIPLLSSCLPAWRISLLPARSGNHVGNDADSMSASVPLSSAVGREVVTSDLDEARVPIDSHSYPATDRAWDRSTVKVPGLGNGERRVAARKTGDVIRT